MPVISVYGHTKVREEIGNSCLYKLQIDKRVVKWNKTKVYNISNTPSNNKEEFPEVEIYIATFMSKYLYICKTL